MPKHRRKSSLKLKEPVLQYEKFRLVSLAVCAGGTDVYHVCLSSGEDILRQKTYLLLFRVLTCFCVSDSTNVTLAVAFDDRMNFLKRLFAGESRLTIACFDVKEHFKMLYRLVHEIESR